MSAGEKPVVRVSVRAVVETTLHESDLGPASMARMREGSVAHRLRQREGERTERAYRAETALSSDYEADALTLRVTGRADALLDREDGVTIVEEIKLGAPDAPLVPAHRAQAAMYGHMLCQREGLSLVCLRVLYVNAAGQRLAAYEEEQTAQALRSAFEALCAPAAVWEAKRLLRRQARDASLAALPFPFETYRAGQRRFAGAVYVAVRDRQRLFAQAPTGIGKTMAALYPALRAVGEGRCARAVFLTARTTGRRSAMEALSRIARFGARLLAAEIAAKDKVCVQETRDCRPERCPRAAGFYDRLPAALEEALAQAGEPGGALLGREAVEALAQKHALCPFELSLELARLADAVVCDYNYVYDPFVAMDALLGAPGGAALLVDEAHQLAGRVRDALSSELSLDALTLLRREAGRQFGRKGPLYRALSRAIAALREAAQLPEFESGGMTEPPKALCAAMEAVLDAAAAQLAQGGGGCAPDVFSLAASFKLAAGKFDERYALLSGGGEKHAALTLLCLSAAPEILAVSKRARGTVYFSATLAPFDAAGRMLGSEPGDGCLLLPSPFDPAQLEVRLLPIDIRYAARERTLPDVAHAIARHLREHGGHALVFLPSYAYLARVHELLLGEEGLEETVLLRERRAMREEEKNALLGAFEADADGERAALLCVLGGGFAEGIDLPGERLSNVIVVSTALPQPDARVRAMQAYYDSIGEDGFFLSMTLPGMVRVIQAAGRLIRTDADTGSLLLIDSRFAQSRIRSLFEGTLIGEAMKTDHSKPG